MPAHFVLEGVRRLTVSNFIPDFASIDLETTGLDPSKSDIIEVGATIFRGGVESEHFSSLIRPTRPLPDRISALTGLAAGELDWAKSFSEVMPGFLDFIKDLPIVAHNAEFDMGFLREKLPRIENEIPTNPIWDNLKLGVLLYPELQSYGLESLANFFNIPFTKTHRASEDCKITGRLFVEFLKNVPSILPRDIWEVIINEYLVDEPLSVPLRAILDHPDYDKHKKSSNDPRTDDFTDGKPFLLETEINQTEDKDLLFKVSFEHEQRPEKIFENFAIYSLEQKHYFSFPTTQYPGDFWGISKKWNNIIDRSENLVLYPGKNRILCKRQVKIFIDDDPEDRLSLTGYEIAVLKLFTHSSCMGNFSRLSWWIWNNLKNLANAISFINASNCDSKDCPFANECFYQETLKQAEEAKLLAFPYRVIKEENGLPSVVLNNSNSDLTFLTPEGIFRDSLSAGINTFSLVYNTVLMEKIENLLPESTSAAAVTVIEKTNKIINELCEIVDQTISSTGNRRLQKGKRFFLFIEQDIIEKSTEIIKKLGDINGVSEEFLAKIEKDSTDSIEIIARMLRNSINSLQQSLDRMARNEMVLCLDKIEGGPADTCRFMFFPHIYESEFLEIPPDVTHVKYLSHHITDSDDWRKYSHLLGRDDRPIDFHDLSDRIPDGNRIYLAPPSSDENNLSKKKLMSIKGNLISSILNKFPGRTIVIVRGSQELLNFKYRLSPRLKSSGYWPLFQKQDGPKGLLIKEFSKHQNVVFFGLTDLVGDIWQFSNPPDNVIFESLHLTSLQDPIEAFIKKEIEKAGENYETEYLEPRIHFTLTQSLNKWSNYLSGTGKIFILDERLTTSDSGLRFINQLNGEISELDV